MPLAHSLPDCRTWGASVVKLRPLESSSSWIRSGSEVFAARMNTMEADTTLRPGAWRPAATIAWASIWLPSTTPRWRLAALSRVTLT